MEDISNLFEFSFIKEYIFIMRGKTLDRWFLKCFASGLNFFILSIRDPQNSFVLQK